MTDRGWDIGDDGAELLAGSLLLGGAQRAVDAVGRASADSRVLAGVHGVWEQYHAAPIARRIELAGIAFLAFAATYLALLLIIPRRVAPLYPVFVWGFAGVLGFVCMTAAGALATAYMARRH